MDCTTNIHLHSHGLVITYVMDCARVIHSHGLVKHVIEIWYHNLKTVMLTLISSTLVCSDPTNFQTLNYTRYSFQNNLKFPDFSYFLLYFNMNPKSLFYPQHILNKKAFLVIYSKIFAKKQQ